MKKRLILFTILIMLIPFALTAEDKGTGDTNKTLLIKATVAEDHGVEKPKNAIALDRLVFELELSTESEALIESDWEINISELSDEGRFSIGLLYYGNQSSAYKGIVTVFSSYAWAKSDRSGAVIPLSVSLSIPQKLADGIEVTEVGINALSFTVNPTGPRRGEKLASIDFDWALGIDVLPGEYYSEVNIGLTMV